MKIIKSKNLSQKGQNLGAFNGVFHEKHSFGIRSKENLKRIKSLALLFLTFLLTTGFSFYNPQTKWKGDTPVLEFKVFLNTDLFTEEEAVARLNVIKEATGEWFGFPMLTELAQDIEQMMRENSLGEIDQKMAQLNDMCAKIIAGFSGTV